MVALYSSFLLLKRMLFGRLALPNIGTCLQWVWESNALWPGFLPGNTTSQPWVKGKVRNPTLAVLHRYLTGVLYHLVRIPLDRGVYWVTWRVHRAEYKTRYEPEPTNSNKVRKETHYYQWSLPDTHRGSLVPRPLPGDEAITGVTSAWLAHQFQEGRIAGVVNEGSHHFPPTPLTR